MLPGREWLGRSFTAAELTAGELAGRPQLAAAVGSPRRKRQRIGAGGATVNGNPMPELPEVEHTRRKLVRWMKGARLDVVSADDRRIVAPASPRAFVRALTGRTLKSIDRRGKWLRLTFDDGALLFGHLGMTGWFERDPAGAPPRRFERIGFDVTKGKVRHHVGYVDPRRWGRWVLAGEEPPAFRALGPDPLVDGIDVERLRAIFARRKRTVKEVLMDQTVLAGVGNIQAIEALWRARIDPRSLASALRREDTSAIVRGLLWTITRTLADLEAEDGAQLGAAATAANPFTIYGRMGTPCPRCATALVRIMLGGRTTTLCPGCQRRRTGPRSGSPRRSGPAPEVKSGRRTPEPSVTAKSPGSSRRTRRSPA